MTMSRSLWVSLLAIGLGAAGIRAGEADVPPDVARVFNRNKGGFYAIYNRALRDDPRLGGKVTFQFTIDVAGGATSCRIVSSDLSAPDVERKMCDKIMLMKFDPQPAAQTVVKSMQFFSRVELPAN
jgi:hypothetical protein